MVEFELAQAIHFGIPFLGGAICVIIGIIIANIFWKARIHRYAKTEIVETLEYQKNKITQLEKDITDRDHTISDLRGYLGIARKSALTIIGATEKEKK